MYLVVCYKLKANPEKFQAILLNCKSEVSDCLYVNGCSIEPSEAVALALLEVRLDNRVRKQADKADIGQDVRMAFILSNFQYCPAKWHHGSVSNTRKLDKIRERTQRYVTNDYKSDYISLLCQISFPSLEGRSMTTENSYSDFQNCK